MTIKVIGYGTYLVHVHQPAQNYHIFPCTGTRRYVYGKTNKWLLELPINLNLHLFQQEGAAESTFFSSKSCIEF